MGKRAVQTGSCEARRLLANSEARSPLIRHWRPFLSVQGRSLSAVSESLSACLSILYCASEPAVAETALPHCVTNPAAVAFLLLGKLVEGGALLLFPLVYIPVFPLPLDYFFFLPQPPPSSPSFSSCSSPESLPDSRNNC